MKTNIKPASIHTHEGGVAKRITYEQMLRRSVMACMLWEDEFYEDGNTIAARIAELIPKVKPEDVALIASHARGTQKLRHVPLLIVREMCRYPEHKKMVAATLEHVIQRADELAEFLAIYWKDGKTPVAAQVKKGLASAFRKFNAFQLAKYNRDGAIKLRDVLFLCHAKPKDDQQAADWKMLVDGTLPIPDTWESQLSAGADKGGTFARLIAEKKLGALALLRNLRNMTQANVPEAIIRQGLTEMDAERVLPFRFVAAARHAPQFEPELELAMFKCLTGKPQLPGKTILLIDVSGSMTSPVSGKSDMTRLDAACALAMLLREVCEHVGIHTFSDSTVTVPARRGFALRDAIVNSQPHSSTRLGRAVGHLSNHERDRIIVITDEQSHDKVPDPKGEAYMINVASYRNGVGYGPWTHIDGWSEAIVDYIYALNGQSND